MANNQTKIQIGMHANVTAGFDPTWIPGDNGHTGLFQTPSQPLIPQDYLITPEPIDWGFPKISLHDTAEDLLSCLFPYKIVHPAGEMQDAEIAAGALLIGDRDRESAVNKLSDTLGIPLGAQGYGFAIIQLRHEMSNQAKHASVASGIHIFARPKIANPEYGITEDFRQDLVKIRPLVSDTENFDPANMTPKNAQQVIDLFQKWGSHYISSITPGGMIFQVLAFNSDRYDKVKNSFNGNDFTGTHAFNFMQFTAPVNGDFGYVSNFGKILSMNGDPALQAALTAKEWNDPKWAGNDSIFAPWSNDKGFQNTLAQKYTASGPIAFELTGITLFAEYNRRNTIKRVAKGIMIQKFGNAVKPHFESYSSFNSQTVIPQSEIKGLVTTIATPVISTYLPKLDMADLQFVAADTVEKFSLCSNLLISTAGSPVQLPGNDIAIIVQVASFESENDFKSIQLSDAGFKQYQISAGEFFGCLQISNTTGDQRVTVLDGLTYEFGDPDLAINRNTVKVVTDIRMAPSPDLVARQKDNISFSYAFADSVLAGNPAPLSGSGKSPGTREFVLEAMNWLGTILLKNPDSDLLSIRMRALDAVRMARYPQNGTYVPILPPERYKEAAASIMDYIDEIKKKVSDYQQQIRDRKTQELVINVGKALNNNIIESGRLLSDFVQANIAQQNDLTGYYATIISQKQSKLEELNSSINKLQINVTEQQQEVNTAIDDYKTAIHDWTITEEINIGLEVAGALFTIAEAIVMPENAAEEATQLVKVFKKIKKILEVLEKTYKVYESINAAAHEISDANDALGDLSDTDLDISSNTTWDEMSANFSTIIEETPKEIVDPKVKLKVAFNILVLRGKALMAAKSDATQLARDIYNQQRLQEITKAQQNRFDQIQTSLKPENTPNLDPLKLDLAGMTGSLMFIWSQMLGILVRTFIQQDQALQYQYLQPATPITSFDLLSMKGAVVTQSRNTLAAQQKLGEIQFPTTAPIPVSIDIPVEKLKEGNVYALPVCLDNVAFIKYMDVRVKSVMLNVKGSVAVDSKTFFVRLQYDGNPFYDRTPAGNPVVFNTPSRARDYEFEVGSNSPAFTDGGDTWSDGVSNITPFSNWYISFPVDLNKGILFSGVTINITLSFTLRAGIMDSFHKPSFARSMAIITPGAVNLPPLEELVSNMAGKTVVNNWDVVFNMSLDKIQKALNKQFDELKSNTAYGGKISCTSTSQVTLHITAHQKFELQYAYPKMTFDPHDSQQVSLTIPVTSGSVTNGSSMDGGTVQWDPPVNVDPGASVTALVPLSLLTGKVTPGQGDANKVYSVGIDFSKGSFTSSNLEVQGDDMGKAAFNDALKDYFMDHEITFILSSLDTNKIATLDDMRPNQFVFKTLITPNNSILQLFISTGTRPALDPSLAFLNNLPEPIPLGSDCSLIISNKLFFNTILENSLNKKGWSLQGVIDPVTKQYSTEYTGGVLVGRPDLSPMDLTWNDNGGLFVIQNNERYSVENGIVTLAIKGSTLAPAKPAYSGLIFSCSAKQTIPFIQDYWRTSDGLHKLTTFSSEFMLEIAANIEMTIKGSDLDQDLEFVFAPGTTHDYITGHLSGGGPCSSDDVQATFNQQLKAQLPDQIISQLNSPFSDVSMFALKNLLFPGDNFITLQFLRLPGDLLITGVFNDVK